MGGWVLLFLLTSSFYQSPPHPLPTAPDQVLPLGPNAGREGLVEILLWTEVLDAR